MKTITEDQYRKLIDCEVLQSDYVTYKPAKFYNRGLSYVNIAVKNSKGEILICSYSCSKIKVSGIELEYIPSYSFTNPRNPFKNN
jgi:hypothetical protein